MRNGLIIDSNGNKYWYKNDKIHRIGGPAIEYTSSTKWWFMNGKLHREDGPAIEYVTGHKSWYLDNKNISQEEFDKLIKLKTFLVVNNKFLEDIEYKNVGL